MHTPSLTIVIPAFNEEACIGACLDTIANQTVPSDEVIVVDNNSSDRTVEITRRYSFVTVLHEERQGIVYARNRGFDAATGDIIGRIDADTLLPRQWVAQLKDYFTAPDANRRAITGGLRFYNIHMSRVAATIYSLLVFRLNRLLLGYYFTWGSNSALPRQAWTRVRKEVIVRSDIHEDLDLGIHLSRCGYQIGYTPHLVTGVQARRIFSDRGALWPWLAMWPRTFRLNGSRTWPVIWLLVILIWLGRYGLLMIEVVISAIDRSR